MKKNLKRMIVILMLIVTLFEVAMPQSGILYERNVVYADGEEEFIEEGYKRITVDATDWYLLSDSSHNVDKSLYIYFLDQSGEKCYPSSRKVKSLEVTLGSSWEETEVYLTANTVYYTKQKIMVVPHTSVSSIYTVVDENGPGIIEQLFAYAIYGLANLVHWSVAQIVGKTVTIDDLVFNKFPDTNISFFKKRADVGDMASVIVYGTNGVGGLNGVVNQWYGIFRSIALMGYMAILVYMGIRIMIGSTAEKKADYKALFMNWVMGIAILLLFPFAMKYMIEVNNAFVKMMDVNRVEYSKKNAPIETGVESNKISVEDAIKWEEGDDYMSVIAYMVKTERRLALAIAFLILTWQFVTLLFYYYKRLFMVAFLIVIFPLVALSFAVDKVADGKSQAFNTWLKEFILAVFVQSFHALVYVFVCSTIYSATGAGGKDYDFILIIIGTTFLFKGESIVRSIFGQISAASSVKTLAESAVGTFAKMAIAEKAIKGVTSYTVGEKSPISKVRRGVNKIRANNARRDAFDVTATQAEEPNIGLRLEHAPTVPKKYATPEQKEEFKKNLIYFNAAAVLNNPNSHSLAEQAAAQELLKKLAMTDPDNDVFRDTKMTAGQLQALVALDRDTMRMVNEGRNTLDIERNVTARLGVIFPGDDDEQIKKKVDRYFTNLYMNGGSVSGASKRQIRSKVDETIDAINNERKNIKYGTGGDYDSEIDSWVSDKLDRVFDEADAEGHGLSDKEKDDMRELARNTYILRRRHEGEFTREELLNAADYVRTHAYEDDVNQQFVEQFLNSESDADTVKLDIDTLTHVIAKKEAEETGSDIAKGIVKEYEDHPRECYFDDEISSHEIIKNMDAKKDSGESNQFEEMIDSIFKAKRKVAKDETMNMAYEVLTDRKVDILENSLDTQVRTQEGLTYEEIQAKKIMHLNDMLTNLSPIKGGADTSLLSRYAEHIINKGEEERTGISKKIDMRKDNKGGFWNKTKNFFDMMTDDDLYKDANDVISERKSNREKIKNDHFLGDVITEEEKDKK